MVAVLDHLMDRRAITPGSLFGKIDVIFLQSYQMSRHVGTFMQYLKLNTFRCVLDKEEDLSYK